GVTGPTDSEGGYYSTVDADSENEEGRFYVWDRSQVSRILTPEEYGVIASYYGLEGEPNFEHKHWHLEIVRPLAKVAEGENISLEEAQQRLDSAKRKLFLERELRIHPGRDEKVLSSWNGLMIKGMARAGRVFGRDDWVQSAAFAVD